MRIGACVVRAPNWVGDAVMSLGGLRELRRVFGEIRLAVAARPWVAAIYEETGLVDEVVVFERHSWRDALSHARSLRGRHYDAAVLFQNAFEAAAVARIARIPRIAGYATERRGALLTDRIAMPGDSRTAHQSRYYAAIAAGVEAAWLGASTVDLARIDCSLEARPETVELGRRVIDREGVDRADPLVCINPGATNSRAKQWLPERFAQAAESIAEPLDARIVIVGSSAESETARAVAAAMKTPGRAIDCSGRTTLRELIGLLAISRALVSNDTGPAHLAAALSTPTVTIFGPTEIFSTAPLGKRAVVVSHPVDCAPCMLRDCPIDHRCMTGVTDDAVVTAARGAIGTDGGKPA